MARSIIIGMGEVGTALHEVLSSVHKVYQYDLKDLNRMLPGGAMDVLHICLPYSDTFVDDVRIYQQRVVPEYTVIHSTVPVGTTRLLHAHYSPVRGVHPHLAEFMRRGVTYLAPEPTQELRDYFLEASFQLRSYPTPTLEETEAGKLWSLAAFAWSIMLEKEIHAYCEQRGLDASVVYRDFTHTYNEMYQELGMPNVVRPVLNHVPGPIGGHCVIPACEKLALLDDQRLARVVLNWNMELEAQCDNPV